MDAPAPSSRHIQTAAGNFQTAGFEQAKVMGEAAFSAELLASDPTAREIAKNLELSPERAKDLASSVVSIKVSAVKPVIS